MSKVDWSAPLEAVHEDGRVVAATYDRTYLSGHKVTFDDGEGDGPWSWCCHYDGNVVVCDGWHIRNVQPAATTDTPKDVVERMVALVRWLGDDAGGGELPMKWCEKYEEARAIAALLPEPIDPDLVAAQKIAAEHCKAPSIAYTFLNGSMDEGQYVQAILAGIKHGQTKGTPL